jgi:hypothetical protein
MKGKKDAPSNATSNACSADAGFLLYQDHSENPDASGLSTHLTRSLAATATASSTTLGTKMQHQQPSHYRTSRTLLGGLKSGLRPFLEDTAALDPLAGLRRIHGDDDYWHDKVDTWRSRTGRDARAVADDADEFVRFQEHLRSLQYYTSAPIKANLYHLLRRQRSEMEWRHKRPGRDLFPALPSMSQYEREFSSGASNGNSDPPQSKPSSPKSVVSVVHFESTDDTTFSMKRPPCVSSMDAQGPDDLNCLRDYEEKKDDSYLPSPP